MACGDGAHAARSMTGFEVMSEPRILVQAASSKVPAPSVRETWVRTELAFLAICAQQWLDIDSKP